jgi:hypothetical protein
MNSSGLKPVSEAIPHQTLSSYPCDCQLIDFLSFLRSLGDRRREDERADAITTCGSWRLEASKELERKEKRPRRFMQQRWNEESESIGRSPPPLPLFTSTCATHGENVVHIARCPHPTHVAYTNNDKQALAPPNRQQGAIDTCTIEIRRRVALMWHAECAVASVWKPIQ